MKLIFNVKAVILLMALLGLGIYLLPGSGPLQEPEQAHEPVQALPDFDRRKVKKAEMPVKPQVPADFDADELLAESQQALDVIIQEYNQVLADPEARKLLEQRMKETAQAYKKAVLAKVQKGEI